MLKTHKRQHLHVLTGLIKFVVLDCIRLTVFYMMYHNGMNSNKK